MIIRLIVILLFLCNHSKRFRTKNSNKIPIIIDTDPGIDDCIALMIALSSDELDIKGITTVSGNVDVDKTQINARKICTFMNRRDINVYAGSSKSLIKEPIYADDIHGKDGICGVILPEPEIKLQKMNAVDYIIKTLLKSPIPITIATLGSLTNIATALIKCPEIVNKISNIVVMGGGIDKGNITKFAEFNIYVDPHSAHIVFSHNIPITLITLNITNQVLITSERLNMIKNLNTRKSNLVTDFLSVYGEEDKIRDNLDGIAIHDASVIIYILHPELFDGYKTSIDVELYNKDELGKTTISQIGTNNINLINMVNDEKVFNFILSSLS